MLPTTSRYRTLAALVLAIPLVAPASHAAPTPAAKCESGKNLAAANQAKCLAAVYRKSMMLGTPADVLKLQKCSDVAVKAFDKAELRAFGLCPTEDDGGEVADAVRACVDDVVADLGGPVGSGVPEDRCQSKKIVAAGTYAQCVSKAYSRALTKGVAPDFSKCGPKVLKSFADLDARGPCATTGDGPAIQEQIDACAADVALHLSGYVPPPPPTPTAFRMTTITLQAPAFIVPIDGFPGSVWCALDQRHTLTDLVQGYVDGDSDGDSFRDLSLVLVEDDDAQTGLGTGTAATAQCAHADPTSCTLTPGGFEPELVFDHQAGSCAVGPTTIPGGGFGCFATVAQSFPIEIGPISLSLEEAQAGARYDGNPATGLSLGLMRGFLSEATAAVTIIDAATPVVGGQPLTAILRGAQCAPFGYDERTLGPGGVLGWWFELAYTAQQVTLP